MVLTSPMRRLNAALLLLAFVLSLFAGRLVQLQGMDSGTYARKALMQGLRDDPLPALRGDIVDAGGVKLAMTVETRTVFADPTLIPADKKGAVAAQVAAIMGLDPAAVQKQLSTPGTHYVVLKRGEKPERAQEVLHLGYPGLYSSADFQREYPAGVAANLLGFVNSDGKGGAGVELSLNKLLAGRDGRQIVEYSPSGQRIPMGVDQIKKPVPGRSVKLTILSDLQYKAEQAIAAQVRKTGARNGTVIVTDPRNGQILAMATAPTFDPENYGQAKPDALGDPAVQELFEPGSTNKVVTAATVMEKGGVTPDTVFKVPYSYSVYGQQIHDAEQHATRDYFFSGVLATSSNVGTMLASDRVSAGQLYDYMRAFGYGQASGLNLPGETRGLLPLPTQWSGTQRYTIAFGQGVGVNALQVASVYSTIANHGVRVAPTLIAGIDDGNGDFTPAAAPRQNRVISDGTATNLIRMLEGVVSKDGTAPEAQIPGYRVAGKTGTAQRVNPGCHCYRGGGYTASFAGFAPADDPQLVVTVVLQDPKGSYYGGAVAAPVFQDVMKFALLTRKIPATGTKSPTVKIYAD